MIYFNAAVRLLFKEPSSPHTGRIYRLALDLKGEEDHQVIKYGTKETKVSLTLNIIKLYCFKIFPITEDVYLNVLKV